jgi:hypothetical protein
LAGALLLQHWGGGHWVTLLLLLLHQVGFAACCVSCLSHGVIRAPSLLTCPTIHVHSLPCFTCCHCCCCLAGLSSSNRDIGSSRWVTLTSTSGVHHACTCSCSAARPQIHTTTTPPLLLLLFFFFLLFDPLLPLSLALVTTIVIITVAAAAAAQVNDINTPP